MIFGISVVMKMWQLGLLFVVALFLLDCSSSEKEKNIGCSNTQIIQLSSEINKAVSFLENAQQSDGSFADSGIETFRVWQTAQVMYFLGATGSASKITRSKGIEFLETNQRSSGSFYRDISSDKNKICLETTPVALLALKTNKVGESRLNKGVNFLLGKQEAGGEWLIGDSTIPEDHDFPSVTGFVLNMLAQSDIDNKEQINAGMSYLIESQLTDGSWGMSWYYYDTPYYAISINLATLKILNQHDTPTFLKALDFIRKNQNDGGYWNRSGTGMSDEFETALALKALTLSGSEADRDRIERAVHWLKSMQQRNGSWRGGFFPYSSPPKEETITTTVMVSEALIRAEFPDAHFMFCEKK